MEETGSLASHCVYVLQGLGWGALGWGTDRRREAELGGKRARRGLWKIPLVSPLGSRQGREMWNKPRHFLGQWLGGMGGRELSVKEQGAPGWPCVFLPVF